MRKALTSLAVARTFESENAGYPCTCLRLELDPTHGPERG